MKDRACVAQSTEKDSELHTSVTTQRGSVHCQLLELSGIPCTQNAAGSTGVFSCLTLYFQYFKRVKFQTLSHRFRLAFSCRIRKSGMLVLHHLRTLFKMLETGVCSMVIVAWFRYRQYPCGCGASTLCTANHERKKTDLRVCAGFVSPHSVRKFARQAGLQYSVP